MCEEMDSLTTPPDRVQIEVQQCEEGGWGKRRSATRREIHNAPVLFPRAFEVQVDGRGISVRSLFAMSELRWEELAHADLGHYTNAVRKPDTTLGSLTSRTR
jgi:hypothetical protein